MRKAERKIELLAPAGNMDALKAAVAGGCDAVYLGGTLFSARAFAGNFNHEELIEAVRYCHVRGVCVYVTLNTLLFETEVENAMKEVEFLYEHDVDALLVQDLGLFRLVRQCFPDFPVHCSTQMHIHNLSGVRMMQKLGAERVVLARETPLELIRECCREDIDIEVFVYGALCISYSGQCLMSESLKNRSGNRGMCAQCCRLKYFEDDVPEGKSGQGDYLLSPKDLNTLERLPELLDAGVRSLKIEGRMKRPEYVYLVTSAFREAIDAWKEGRQFRLNEDRMNDLKLMFNRGFTEGHVFHADTKSRMNPFRPNHQGLKIGEVIEFRKGKVCVKLSAPLYQHDGLRILNEPSDTGLTAVRIEKNGLLVPEAEAGDTVWLDCRSKPAPKPGQPLHKTSDARLIEETDRRIGIQRLIPVTVDYQAEPGIPLILQARDGEGHDAYAESDYIIEPAKKAPVTKERIEAALAKSSDEPYDISFGSGAIGNVFLPVSVINETRRQLLSALSDLRAVHRVNAGRKPYVPYKLSGPSDLPPLLSIAENETASYPCEAIVSKQGTYRLRDTVNEADEGSGKLVNCILASAGDLYHEKENCICGYTMNCANSYALEFLLSQTGVEGVILSTELQNTQIRMMLEAFADRFGFVPFTYRLVYGRRVLMYIKDGVMISPDTEEIRDIHGNRFPLKRKGNLLEILEQEPYRSDNPFCSGSCLIFTDESKRDRQAVKEEAYEELYQRI